MALSPRFRKGSVCGQAATGARGSDIPPAGGNTHTQETPRGPSASPEPEPHSTVSLKRELPSLFRGLFQERRGTAIHVTHGLREAASLGVMESGRIAQVGTFSELRGEPVGPFVRGLVEDLRGQEPPDA